MCVWWRQKLLHFFSTANVEKLREKEKQFPEYTEDMFDLRHLTLIFQFYVNIYSISENVYKTKFSFFSFIFKYVRTIEKNGFKKKKKTKIVYLARVFDTKN